ncbi:hypothetical protein TSAR_002262, partial [Trichomalopsis sarcophagae]
PIKVVKVSKNTHHYSQKVRIQLPDHLEWFKQPATSTKTARKQKYSSMVVQATRNAFSTAKKFEYTSRIVFRCLDQPETLSSTIR